MREGQIEYQREPMVYRYHFALPKMDVISLGLAGGCSIISVDQRTGIPDMGRRALALLRPGLLRPGGGGANGH